MRGILLETGPHCNVVLFVIIDLYSAAETATDKLRLLRLSQCDRSAFDVAPWNGGCIPRLMPASELSRTLSGDGFHSEVEESDCHRRGSACES